MTTRFYVTLTWDNFPEGGSYGTIVEADDYEAAETMARQEMAAIRAEGEDGDGDEDELADPAYWLKAYAHVWHVIDCFKLDDFLDNHRPLPRAPSQGHLIKGVHREDLSTVLIIADARGMPREAVATMFHEVLGHPPHVRKILDISTAHVSEKTGKQLTIAAHLGQVPAVYEKGDYGWLVHVPNKPREETSESFPADLRACLEHARSLDCDWIMFDRDGDVIEALPEYEW